MHEAGIAFRCAANLESEDRKEPVSCQFPKTIFCDYKRKLYKVDCIHNSETYYGEEIPLKLTFEFDIGNHKKPKLSYKAEHALKEIEAF